jgi:hypothetical protein
MDKEYSQGGRDTHLVLGLEPCKYSIILFYSILQPPDGLLYLIDYQLRHDMGPPHYTDFPLPGIQALTPGPRA